MKYLFSLAVLAICYFIWSIGYSATLCAVTLGVLAASCVLNFNHAHDYQESWKRTLVAIAIFAVASVPKVARLESVPLELLCLVVAVTWQNLSMMLGSWKRQKERAKITGEPGPLSVVSIREAVSKETAHCRPKVAAVGKR